ncbi:hypothetical protein GQ44DRAFT_777660 [Phaeosphaeriaceae sp. PMI808]|nr:hypothetical protein GQ44DRAFT_777660 [Phaeosphaeriaceae sp. PMI808]
MRESLQHAPSEPLRRRRRRKQQRRDQSQQQPASSLPVYVCIDWGASYWRQYTSLLGVTPPEPSLVLLQVRFENLKALFDEESGFREAESKRIRDLGIETSIEAVLEKWWCDRMGPLLKRVGPRETITFAVAHPAHFSPRSVQRLRAFFAQGREGRTFRVVVSEEATAALHGSRYSGFKSGDIVLVVDGGKSTIDCACLQNERQSIAHNPYFETSGLSDGADYINQAARKHAEDWIREYAETALQMFEN